MRKFFWSLVDLCGRKVMCLRDRHCKRERQNDIEWGIMCVFVHVSLALSFYPSLCLGSEVAILFWCRGAPHLVYFSDGKSEIS